MSTKTANTHTPGPWTLGVYGSIVGGPFLKYANGKAQSQIASATIGNGIEIEEREANARLIAAAPELLQALENAFSAMRNHVRGERNYEWALEFAEQVIAKAKGAL